MGSELTIIREGDRVMNFCGIDVSKNSFSATIKNRKSITRNRLFKKEKGIEILASIPGVGKESAIYFIVEVVDIKRFSGCRKLIGFCGLDP